MISTLRLEHTCLFYIHKKLTEKLTCCSSGDDKKRCFNLIDIIILQEAEAILEEIKPTPLKVVGFGVVRMFLFYFSVPISCSIAFLMFFQTVLCIGISLFLARTTY